MLVLGIGINRAREHDKIIIDAQRKTHAYANTGDCMAEEKTHKNGENMSKVKETQKADAKADSSLPIIPMAGVLIILIGAVLLWQGGMIPGFGQWKAKPTGNNTTVVDPLADPSAKILLSYMGKQSSLPNAYDIQFVQPQDGIPLKIRLEQNGAARRATVTSLLYASSFTWIGNETVVCEQNGDAAQKCAALNATSALNQDANQLNAMFSLDANATKQQVAVNQKLIQYGAFVFISPPRAAVIANRTCQNLTYTLNYSALDGQELANIQAIQPAFSAPSPQVFNSFHLEQCMDDEYGIALYSRLNYKALNTDGTYALVEGERELVSFGKTAPNIALPATGDNLEDVQASLVSDQQEMQQVSGCQSMNTTAGRDACMRQSAIDFSDVRFCNMSSNETAQGDCIIKMATQSGNVVPALCEQAGAARSECYANVAYIKRDASYCQLVTDAALKAQCISAIQNQTASKPAANNNNTTAGGNSAAQGNSTVTRNSTAAGNSSVGANTTKK